MAKPTDEKDKDKSIDGKKPEIKMDTNQMIIVNNIVIIIVLVVAMIVMYVLLDSSISKKISQVAPQENQSEEETDEEKQEGILLDLGDFILNLTDAAQRRYLKVSVALELSKTEEELAKEQAPAEKSGGHGAAAPADPNAAIVAEMERYKPAIRDAVISVLSNKTADELSTPTGKEIAKEEILEMVNNVFEGQREVMRVSFGQFIIQ